MAGTDTFALHEELGQFLRVSIRDCQIVIFDLEGRILILSVISIGWGFWLSFGFFAVFSSRFLLDDDCLWFSEDLVLDFVFLDVFSFVSELKSYDCLHFSDMLLDHEELIHEAKFESVFFASQTAGIAKAFQKNELMIGSSLNVDRMLNKLNN